MVFNYFNNIGNQLLEIQRKLPLLSKSSQGTAPRFKTIKGIALFLFAVCFAYSAHQWSYRSGTETFDTSTWPNKRSWQATLTSLGYHQISVSENSELLKNHPDPFATKPQIWIRDDFKVVYLNASPFNKNSAELWVYSLYNRVSQAQKLNWIRLSSGISAFNTMINELEKLKAPLIRPLGRNLVDPKEIRY